MKNITQLALGILFLLICSVEIAHAQIEPQYNMYRLNPQVYNPMTAGSRGDTSEVFVMYRQQWLGIQGAPQTFFFNGNFKWKERRGIGVNAMLDQLGPVKMTTFSGDFAYHTRLSEKWILSGGIRLGLANVALNFTGLALTNQGDPLFNADRSTGLKFNTGWGVKISKQDGFFVSFAMPRIIKYDFGELSGGYQDATYMYTMLGTKLELSDDLTLYPNAMARIATDFPLSWDVQLMANLRGKLDAGLNYRHQESIGIRLGLQASKKFYLGYVYEMPTGVVSKISNQTHEFALRFFILKDKSQRTTSPDIDPQRGPRQAPKVQSTLKEIQPR
jgi:type IX secretion system PorP/SprF family membrane protein